ncbi:hypothetical protein LXJ15735_28710 [Lacrimispora xylanolytica]
MWIVLLIILVLLAWFNGDSSGVEMIVKVVAIGALILATLWLFMKLPWLVLGVVFFIILYANYKSYKNNKKSNIDNFQTDNSEVNIRTPLDNMTKFKEELNQITKSPEQVKNEIISMELEAADKSTNISYEIIKQQLLEKAETGQYEFTNGNKIITIDYMDYNLSGCLNHIKRNVFINKTLFNPHGEYTTENIYSIVKQEYYDFYLSKINKLAKEDGIVITPVLVNNSEKDLPVLFDIPCIIQGFRFEYKLALRCTICY